MKTIKFLLILIATIAIGEVSAQLNAGFTYEDSCYNNIVFIPDNPNAYSMYIYDYGDGTIDTLYNSGFGWHQYVNNGVYTVTLTVVHNGLTNSYTNQSVTANSYILPFFNYTPISSSCSGPIVYQFSGTTNNGLTSYMYDWYIDNQWVSNSQNFTYTFTQTGIHYVDFVVTDPISGCSDVFSAAITVTSQSNLAVGATYQTINSNCNGAIVDLFSTVSGGTPPYTYQWSWYDFGNSTATHPQQVNVLTSIDPWVYLTVTDSNGCSASTQIAIQNNNLLTAVASSSPTNGCGNNCDGSISVSATGTAGPYIFELLGTNQVLNGYQVVFDSVCAGGYDIIVSDATGCQTVLTEIVTQDSLAGFNLDVVVQNSGNCANPNVCNGSIDIIPIGGNSPYQYSLNGGITYSSQSLIDSLCPGTYDIIAVDSNGCVASAVVTVGGFQPLGVQTYEYYESCDSNSVVGNGSIIQVYPFGGAGNYSFAWSNGDSSSTIFDPAPGIHTVIVTDAAGCTYSHTFDVPMNDCYTISGHVYVDVNNNCIFDSGDYPVSCFVDLTATAGGPWLWIYDYTDSNGYYEITTGAGTYFFDINGMNVNNLSVGCPGANYSVTVDSLNQNVTVDFFLVPPPPTQDLSISMWTAYTFTPGYPTYTTVMYCNDGTIPMSGNVVVNYDPELVWYQSGTTPSGHTINNDVPSLHDAANNMLVYDFVGLMPGQCVYLDVDYETPIGTGLMPGDPILIDAVVNPIPGDVTPTNNTAYLNRVITSSWDPNDKAVSPEGDITVDDNDHDYYIRFQNEGNGVANVVVIKDEIDANLDLRSLRNVQASHDYILTIENDNTLVFTFNNIYLQPMSVDEPASKGFVAFTLTQDGDLPVGTVIENTAAIYFDFNPAIITNTVENEIVEKTTGITNPEVEGLTNVYPNPSTGQYQVSIDASLTIEKIRVYDVLGNIILVQEDANAKAAYINIENVTSGVYFLEISTNEGKAVKKLIKEDF